MSACPIPVLSAVLAPADTPPWVVTEGEQAGLQRALSTQLKALPWAEVPVGDRRREAGHGRRETRTIAGKTTRETAYYTVSPPAVHAQPADLQDWVRREWLIGSTRCITSATSRSVKTSTKPGPAAALRSSPLSATP